MILGQTFKIFKLKRFQRQVKLDSQIWEEKKPYIEAQNNIKQEKESLRKKAPHIPYSKLLLLFLFINFTILEIFIGWVTVKCLALAFLLGTAPDFTPLVTLVGAVMGQTISYGIYAAKSKAENTQGGLVYDQARWEFEANNNSNDEEGVG
jgi:hypothetical protein